MPREGDQIYLQLAAYTFMQHGPHPTRQQAFVAHQNKRSGAWHRAYSEFELSATSNCRRKSAPHNQLQLLRQYRHL
jgi:hypothetical protein